MNKNILIATLIVIPLFFVLWFGSLEYDKFTALEVKVSTRGYDPYDLFRGRYIWFYLDWETTDCGQFPKGVCPREDFDNSYKFFLNEKLAQELDRKVRNFGWEGSEVQEVQLVFAYKRNMTPIVKTFLINGVRYDKWYEEHMSSK